MRRHGSALALLVVLVLGSTTSAQEAAKSNDAKDGFTDLFDGKSLSGWETMNGAKFKAEDGLLKLSGGSGWLRSAEEYDNFILRLEVRWLKAKQDSGIFLRAGKEGKNWPDRRYEVQCENSPRVAMIFGAKHERDQDLAVKTLKATGEWNAFEVRCDGRRAEVKLNGVLVTTSDAFGEPKGYLGLQGEGGLLEFRNLSIKKLSAATSAQSEPARNDTFVYVSMAPEQTIQAYRLNPETGALTAVARTAVDGAPGSLAVDPRKEYLFASLRSTSTLASFRIDPQTGKLTQVSTAPLGKDENAAYVATDRSGRWLLSASYAAGNVVVHRLKEGKIETPPVQTLETAKTAHCIAADRDNRYVFVPHVAPNAVFQFRLDADAGKLSPADKAPGGSDKAGPRHLAFAPGQNFAYTSDETGNSITAYRFASGGLKPEQTLSTLPSDFDGKNTTAEVKVHPTGKHVWVSNRGHDSLAGFAIDKNGKLTAVGHTPTERTPRSFEIEPDGRYLFGAGEGSGKLAVFRIDESSGKLTRLHTYEVGKSLTWVMAVKIDGKRP